MKRRIFHLHNPLRNYTKSNSKYYHLITPLIIGKLDRYKNKLFLTTLSILYYTVVESQTFITNNCLMPENMTRINGLARGFTPLQWVAHLPNDSVCLWGSGFRNLKSPAWEKINLFQFDSENLNLITFMPVVSGVTQLSF